jgi:hypothetical protein
MRGRQSVSCLIFCVLITLSGSFALKQSPDIPQLTLRALETKTVSGASAAPAFLPLRCDAGGNVYVRFYEPAQPLRAPIVRISADGREAKALSLTSVTDFRDADIDDFAASAHGSVTLVLWGPDPKTKTGRGYVVTFKDDGTFDADSVVALPPGQTPEKVALFEDGSVLVSGTQEEKLYRNQPAVSGPFTEIFGEDGHLVKRIVLPGDVEPPKPSDKDFTAKLSQLPGEISLGDAQSGTDGYVYLMRQFATPTVYVIASDGSIVRTLHLKPPLPTAREGAMQYSDINGGRLAVAFTIPASNGLPGDREMISLYSTQSGERLVDYIAPSGIGGALACYTQRGFTFLGSTPQHELALKLASAY